MKDKTLIFPLLFALSICVFPVKSSFAGTFAGESVFTITETDSSIGNSAVVYAFDLRERETFIQLTYPDEGEIGIPARAHVQIFDVSNNCTENNFFDTYTVSDTHVYNMRDIRTNDGSSSGVVLPDGSYGIVVISLIVIVEDLFASGQPIGNFRILDNNGYEYRTNAQSVLGIDTISPIDDPEKFYSFNFNQRGGVILSDVFGITLFLVNIADGNPDFEWTATPVQGIFSPFDIDIYDLSETPFSCRDVVFSCVNENSLQFENLLEISLGEIASFEYGINNAIPHSKGGELLCPNNSVSEGTVILRPELYPNTTAFIDIFNTITDSGDNGDGPIFFGFAGLNNGNGRGSMDSFWYFNIFIDEGF